MDYEIIETPITSDLDLIITALQSSSNIFQKLIRVIDRFSEPDQPAKQDQEENNMST